MPILLPEEHSPHVLISGLLLKTDRLFYCGGACGEVFPKQTFICGYRYRTGQLLNFELERGQGVSRKKKLEEDLNVDVASMFVRMVRSRLLVHLSFYRVDKDLHAFKQMWSYEEELCSVQEGLLIFGHLLM